MTKLPLQPIDCEPFDNQTLYVHEGVLEVKEVDVRDSRIKYWISAKIHPANWILRFLE